MSQDMTDVAAVLTEPAATAWHAINLSVLPWPIHECRVRVIGGGAIGMLAGLLFKHLGVVRLTVSEPNPLHREAVQVHAGCKTLNSGGVIMHVGLQDWASEIDMRKSRFREPTLTTPRPTCVPRWLPCTPVCSATWLGLSSGRWRRGRKLSMTFMKGVRHLRKIVLRPWVTDARTSQLKLRS